MYLNGMQLFTVYGWLSKQIHFFLCQNCDYTVYKETPASQPAGVIWSETIVKFGSKFIEQDMDKL